MPQGLIKTTFSIDQEGFGMVEAFRQVQLVRRAQLGLLELLNLTIAPPGLS
jgi:hypothetical protein